MPFGQLLDNIACYQIENGAKERKIDNDDDVFPDLM